jgi:serine/threonine-protein kinase HipA
MREAEIYRNDTLAGILTQKDDGTFEFNYSPQYLSDQHSPAIGLSFPKSQESYQSRRLFPLFFNMLSEGANRKLQCRLHQLDENDHFGLMLAIAGEDTVGAVSVKTKGK